MCGILGAFSNEPIEGLAFSKSLDYLKNRGPDNEGYIDLETGMRYEGENTSYPSNLENISNITSSKLFGNRRLAITGGSDCILPFSYKELTLAYEGEIYNYRRIRRKLQDIGHKFDTKGDTEVFIHAFHEWGLDALSKMEGKWAAGIYNKKSGKLYCFRDHFGTKPIYYLHKEDKFLFSTMISPILKFKESDPEENTKTSLDYLRKDLVDHNRETFFQEVNQLRPGEYLVYENNEVSIGNIPERANNLEKSSTRDIVSRGIKSKIPEKEWTATVSGGLDSSIVVCELSDEITEAYSLDIEKGKFESAEFSRELAKTQNIDLNQLDVSLEDLIENIDKSVIEQEQPTSMLPAQAQNILFHKISESGKKVVLTGSGADELFFGYRRFIPIAIAESWKREGPIKGAKMLINHLENLDKDALIHLTSLLIPETWKSPFRKITRSKTGILEIPEDYDLANINENSQSLIEARESQIRRSWYPAIMRFTDKNAGAHGLESRECFLSQRTLQYLKTQEPLENFREGLMKKTLRDSFQKVLPKKILEREDKTGFLPTDDRAFTSEIREIFRNKFSSDSFNSNRLVNQNAVLKKLENENLSFNIAYKLYCYEIWRNEFIETERFE